MVAGLPVHPQRDSAVTGHLSRSSVDVNDESGVLVDTEHPGAVGEHGLHRDQSSLAEIAEAGVVMAALGVVVVRDHRGVDADRREEVEPVGPERLMSALVDLVDGDGGDTDGQRGGRGEHHDTASVEFRSQHSGHRGVAPLLDGVGRRAWSGEEVVAAPQDLETALDGEAVGVDDAGEARYREVDVNRLGEVGDGAFGQFGRVLLESVGGVEHGGGDVGAHPAGGGFETGRESTVGRDHRRGGLARAHEREDAGDRHRTSLARRVGS